MHKYKYNFVKLAVCLATVVYIHVYGIRRQMSMVT